ncbi:MAG: kinase [Sphingobium sp.]|nr:MAG: kinase [Sphingobium sp.]
MTEAADIIARGISERWIGSSPARRPLVIGLCGAQGSGKTTLATALQSRLTATGLRCATLSLDDLYLTLSEREALGCVVHPLLRTRGVPGTHDVGLGLDTIAALGGEGRVSLPRFDKARDDRLPESAWPVVSAPLDLLLFEGWCVGAVPQDAAELVEPVNALEREKDTDGAWRRHVNAALSGAYRPLFDRIDRLILLAAPGFDVVGDWRTEQEEQLRRVTSPAAGQRIMSAGEISRFIQFYERLTRHILSEMPERADLTLSLDASRRVIVHRVNDRTEMDRHCP